MTDITITKGAVLLIDDLPENLQLLGKLLTQLGYSIRSVNSGRMALRTLDVKQPDVILLDIKMPEMDGYQVCRAIKSNTRFKDIPIIFISALDETFDKVKAFQCGGADYITKPFQIEEVVARLENQLTIQKQKKSLQEEVRKRQETEEVLSQSRALLSSILNTALDGIAAFKAVRDSKSGQIIDFQCLVINPTLAKALQISQPGILGQSITQKFLSCLDSTLLNRFIEVVETGKPLVGDFYYPLGESCWYHFVAVKLADGFAITVRDITSRKKIELELKEANQKLELLANLDGLTHVANRWHFDQQLQKEWKRLQREQQPISLILFDVDYFKLYNDCYGHQAGDTCLKQIAAAAKAALKRPADCVARYGGEEFVVILPNTDQKGAIAIAERIQSNLRQQSIPHEYSEVSKLVSLSLGVASIIPTPDRSPERLILMADQALYKAKGKGKDCIVVFEEDI